MLEKCCVVIALILIAVTGPQIVMGGEDNTEKVRIGDPLPDLVLEDAHGTDHKLTGTSDHYVFLLFGNRRMKDENRRWAIGFKNSYGARADVRIFMIADMRGIPFFITKNFIREQIRKENHPVPLLLDWDQGVNSRLGIRPERINILVGDPAGRLALRREYSGFSEPAFDALHEELDAILRPAVSPRDP